MTREDTQDLVWTNTSLATLIRRISDGKHSYSEIGRELNIKTSSIIWKVGILGLQYNYKQVNKSFPQDRMEIIIRPILKHKNGRRVWYG